MHQTKLAIIGSGPAGYAAAIYSARAQLEPIVLAGSEIGGQLIYTSEVENYPGFPEGILGTKLMTNFKDQAEKFGAKIKFESVFAVDFTTKPFKLWTSTPNAKLLQSLNSAPAQEYLRLASQLKTDSNHDLEAEAVIVCTGATPIMLGLENEKQFLGRGLSACAVCDAAFFKDKTVFVVGGGDSAMEDALALAKYTNQVTVIHRRDSFRASKIMQQRVLNHPHIKVIWNSQVVAIQGEQQLSSIEIETQGKTKSFEADGLFLAIGHRPMNKFFSDQLQLDGAGYIVTPLSLSAAGLQLAKNRLDEHNAVRYPTMTSIGGVFAAGDIVDFHYQQASTAMGMGVSAALDAEAWLGENSKS